MKNYINCVGGEGSVLNVHTVKLLQFITYHSLMEELYRTLDREELLYRVQQKCITVVGTRRTRDFSKMTEVSSRIWRTFCYNIIHGRIQVWFINPFPNDKFWTLPNWEGLQQQFYIWWKWQNVLHNGRKHCRKRKNCSLGAISPFPTVFSKYLKCKHVKTRACLGKG